MYFKWLNIIQFDKINLNWLLVMCQRKKKGYYNSEIDTDVGPPNRICRDLDVKFNLVLKLTGAGRLGGAGGLFKRKN
ncbi:hypothetical protein CW304_18420 [Bacillus sp. UFRGS-B20]|nr:hypothetical protein CW304_18420 [Bacillus sp. UFRGS-B20]